MKKTHCQISLNHGDYVITYQIVSRSVPPGGIAVKTNDVQLEIIQTATDNKTQRILIDPDQIDILTCWLTRLAVESA